MASYAVGDPMEQLCNKLLEIPSKAEESTDVIFHLQHFLNQIIKTLGKQSQLTWMDKIKRMTICILFEFYAVLFPKSFGQYACPDCSPIINHENCSLEYLQNIEEDQLVENIKNVSSTQARQ